MATIVDRYILSVEAKGTRTVQRQIDQIRGSANAGKKALALLRAGLVILASGAIIGRLLGVADSLREMNNRLRLVTNSQSELIAVQRSLFKVSQETRTSLEANVILFQRLSEATAGTGRSYKDLIELTKNVALATAVSGSTAQQASAGLRQFAQAISAGALQGDELTSVVENLPRLAQIVGKEFGIAGGALKAFNRANPGILTTQRILKALGEEAKQLEEDFGNSSITLGQGFQILSNAAVFFLGNLSDTTGAGRALANMMVTLAANIDKVFIALVGFTGLFVFNILIGQVGQLIRALAVMGLAGAKTFGILRVSVLAVLNPLGLLAGTLASLGRVALLPVIALSRAFAFLGVAMAATQGAAIGTRLALFALAAQQFVVATATTAQAAATSLMAAAYLTFNTVMGVLAATMAIVRTRLAAWVILLGLARTAGLAATAATIAHSAAIATWAVITRGAVVIMVALRTATSAATLATVAYTVATKAAGLATLITSGAIKALRVTMLGLRAVMAGTAAIMGILAVAASGFVVPLLVGAAIVGALVAGFFLFREEIGEVLDSLGGFRNIFNVVASSAIAFIKVLFTRFDLFKRFAKEVGTDIGNAFKRAFVGMKNAGTTTFNFMLDAAATLINALSSAINLLIRAQNIAAPKALEIPLIPKVNFEELKGDLDTTTFSNQFRGAGAILAGTITGEFEEQMKDGGPAKVIEDNIRTGLDFLKSLTSTGLIIDEEALLGRFNLDGVSSAAKEVSAAFTKAEKALRSLESSVSPLASANAKMSKALKVMAAAAKQGVKPLVEQDEVLRRLQREIVGVGNEATDYAEKQILLNRALDAGVISMKEMEQQSRALRIDLLDTQTTVEAGFERGILKASDMFKDLATIAEETMTNAFSSIEDSLVSLIRTGNANFSELVNGIADDITRLFVRTQITGPLADVLGLGENAKGGGFLGKIFGEGNKESTGFLSGIFGGIKNLFGGGDKKKDPLLDGIDALLNPTNAAEQLVPGDLVVGGALRTGDGPIGGVIQKAMGLGGQDAATAVGETLGATNAGFFAGLGEKFTGLLGGLGGVFKTGASFFSNIFSSIFGGGAGGGLGGILSGALGGAGGGIAGILGGAITGLLGFQNGGQFQVGGQGGVDSKIVAFRATPREDVLVRTPAQMRADETNGQGGGSVTHNSVHMTIVTPDAGSFKRNEGQILARQSAALEKRGGRNR